MAFEQWFSAGRFYPQGTLGNVWKLLVDTLPLASSGYIPGTNSYNAQTPSTTKNYLAQMAI